MSRFEQSKKKKYLRYTAFVLLAVFCLSALLLFLDVWEKKHSTYDNENSSYESEPFVYMGEEYVQRDDVEIMLVLGLDKFEQSLDNSSYNNDQRADFLLLLVFDNANKTYSAVQLNRDTMAEMSVLGVAGEKIGTVTQQLALAHTYGNGKQVSCRNTADSVSKLLFGLKIDHYVSFTMDAVPEYNDLIGGVTVEVLHDFTGIDDELVKGETVTLRGKQALTYVRERKNMADSSNEKRMERQAQYLNAMFAQTKTSISADENFAIKAVNKLGDYFVSDCTMNQIHEYFQKFSSYNFNELYKVKGEYRVGEKYMEFYPDTEDVKKTVVELCYTKE